MEVEGPGMEEEENDLSSVHLLKINEASLPQNTSENPEPGGEIHHEYKSRRERKIKKAIKEGR